MRSFLETSDDPTCRTKRKDGPLQGGTRSPRNQNSQVDMFGDLLGHKYDDCNKKNYWIEANQLPNTSKMILTHVSNFQLEKKNNAKLPTQCNFHLLTCLSLIKRSKTIDVHRSHPTKTFVNCLNQCSCVCIHLHSIVQITKNHHYLPESEYKIHDTPKNKPKLNSGDTRSKPSFLGFVKFLQPTKKTRSKTELNSCTPTWSILGSMLLLGSGVWVEFSLYKQILYPQSFPL